MVSLVNYLREKMITGRGKKVSKYVCVLIRHFSLLHTIHGDDEREIINDTELSRASLDFTPQNKVSVRDVKENVLNIERIKSKINSPLHLIRLKIKRI